MRIQKLLVALVLLTGLICIQSHAGTGGLRYDEALIPRIPMGRLGDPEEVASVVYFLCSEESTYLSGTEIFVTGAQHIY